MLCVGIITTAVGGGIFYVDFGDWGGAMIAGGFFALMGAGLVLLAIVTTYSGASYLYGQALLRKHGVEVDGVLTKKKKRIVSFIRNTIIEMSHRGGKGIISVTL